MSKDSENSHKTAIGRKKPSAPARWLAIRGYAQGRILDYGCGRGFDADWYHWDKYDPYYFPKVPHDNGYNVYDTIMCAYVLNTLTKPWETLVLTYIKWLLAPGGKAYITIRRNVKKVGYTSKGTYQRNVKLRLPIIHETSDYCIYVLSADSF